MSVRRGLGRGLGALLGEDRGEQGALRQIDPSLIRPNPRQPRTNFDPAALEELSRSIAAFGVLVPLIVREIRGGYELIAGERRWRAATAANLATVPAVVRRAGDRESLEVAIIENLQREDLGPLEEAIGFQQLIDDSGFTQEQLAERLGKSRPSVANALRLLGLPDSVKARLRDGQLSAGHARAILALPATEQEAVATRVVEQQLSVRDVERLATPRDSARRPARKPRRTAGAEHDEFTARLRYRLGAHVSIVPSRTGGKIEIRFSSEADLMRIGDLLLVQERP